MNDRKMEAIKKSIANGESWKSILLCDDPEKAEEAMLRQMAKECCQEFDESEKLQGIYKEFVSKMKPGDRLEYFCSPPSTWMMLCGRAGYQIMRNEEQVTSMVTCLN